MRDACLPSFSLIFLQPKFINTVGSHDTCDVIRKYTMHVFLYLFFIIYLQNIKQISNLSKCCIQFVVLLPTATIFSMHDNGKVTYILY